MAAASITAQPDLHSFHVDERASAYYSRPMYHSQQTDGWRGYGYENTSCYSDSQVNYPYSQIPQGDGHQWTEHMYADWPLPLPTTSWSESLSSGFTSSQTHPSPASSEYTPPSPPSLRYILPCPSPSTSVSSDDHSPLPTLTGQTTAPNSTQKTCSHCSATTTPLWRRDPSTRLPLCNACGLYLQQRHKPRPAALIAADRPESDEEWAQAHDPDAPTCSHCGTRRTSVWRRGKDGARLCNACGVYLRLRGRPRPLTLKQSRVRPRAKH